VEAITTGKRKHDVSGSHLDVFNGMGLLAGHDKFGDASPQIANSDSSVPKSVHVTRTITATNDPILKKPRHEFLALPTF
jgi:hypothetical protein